MGKTHKWIKGKTQNSREMTLKQRMPDYQQKYTILDFPLFLMRKPHVRIKIMIFISGGQPKTRITLLSSLSTSVFPVPSESESI